jgi:probable HAF family extracellular repeat protein
MKRLLLLAAVAALCGGLCSGLPVVRHAQTTIYDAFIWDAEHGMQDLGTLGGVRVSFANHINDKGQVVGSSFDASGHEHAFIWDAKNGMQDLGRLPGAGGYVEAVAINDEGQVVGMCSD